MMTFSYVQAAYDQLFLGAKEGIRNILKGNVDKWEKGVPGK